MPRAGGTGERSPPESGGWALAGSKDHREGGCWVGDAPRHPHPPASQSSECTSRGQIPRNPRAGAPGAAGQKEVSAEDGGRALSPPLLRLQLRSPLLGTAASHPPCPRPAVLPVSSPPAAQPPPACLLRRSPDAPTVTRRTHPTTCPSRPALRPPPPCLVLVPLGSPWA